MTANATFSIKLADYEVNGGAIAAGKVSSEPKNHRKRRIVINLLIFNKGFQSEAFCFL